MTTEQKLLAFIAEGGALRYTPGGILTRSCADIDCCSCTYSEDVAAPYSCAYMVRTDFIDTFGTLEEFYQRYPEAGI